jgi:hypothetical protein
MHEEALAGLNLPDTQNDLRERVEGAREQYNDWRSMGDDRLEQMFDSMAGWMGSGVDRDAALQMMKDEREKHKGSFFWWILNIMMGLRNLEKKDS